MVTAKLVLFLQMFSSLNDLTTLLSTELPAESVGCRGLSPQRLCSLPSSASRLRRLSPGEFLCFLSWCVFLCHGSMTYVSAARLRAHGLVFWCTQKWRAPLKLFIKTLGDCLAVRTRTSSVSYAPVCAVPKIDLENFDAVLRLFTHCSWPSDPLSSVWRRTTDQCATGMLPFPCPSASSCRSFSFFYYAECDTANGCSSVAGAPRCSACVACHAIILSRRDHNSPRTIPFVSVCIHPLGFDFSVHMRRHGEFAQCPFSCCG